MGMRRRLRLLMFALACFLCWAGVTLWNQGDKVSAKISQLAELEYQLTLAAQLNEDLKKEIERLHDDEYIEQRVRRDFHMKKPGDTPYILLPKPE